MHPRTPCRHRHRRCPMAASTGNRSVRTRPRPRPRRHATTAITADGFPCTCHRREFHPLPAHHRRTGTGGDTAIPPTGGRKRGPRADNPRIQRQFRRKYSEGIFFRLADGGKVNVVYVWDVLDANGVRLHRLQGQEAVTARGSDPWAAVTDKVMQDIAAKHSTTTRHGSSLKADEVKRREKSQRFHENHCESAESSCNRKQQRY